MSSVASAVYMQPFVGARRKKVVLVGVWSIANGGVATLVDGDDPSLSLILGATGTYALTYPATPGNAVIKVVPLDTGTPNVFWFRLIAQAASAGTASILTAAAASPQTGLNNTSLGLSVRIEITLDCNT